MLVSCQIRSVFSCEDSLLLYLSRFPFFDEALKLRLNPTSSWRLLPMLFTLAQMGAYHKAIKISTKHLAEKSDISQQTASRHLIELSRIGWIKRSVTPRGCLIKLTESGKQPLKDLYSKMKVLIETAHPLSVMIEGIVFSGLGEGAYYVKQEGYQKQFIEKLGFRPFPGTLNVNLASEHDAETRRELENYPAIEIAGFETESRTFGPVKCYPILINNKAKGAVIFALRSHYDVSVLEIIAHQHLRTHLRIKDNDKLHLEIFTMP